MAFNNIFGCWAFNGVSVMWYPISVVSDNQSIIMAIKQTTLATDWFNGL